MASGNTGQKSIMDSDEKNAASHQSRFCCSVAYILPGCIHQSHVYMVYGIVCAVLRGAPGASTLSSWWYGLSWGKDIFCIRLLLCCWA